MSKPELTYLKPPPPSACYRGCREGCGCEQPVKLEEFVTLSGEPISLVKAVDPGWLKDFRTRLFADFEADIAAAQPGRAYQPSTTRWFLGPAYESEADTKRSPRELVGENGKGGEPYTPWPKPEDMVDCLQDQVHKQSTVHRAAKSGKPSHGDWEVQGEWSKFTWDVGDTSKDVERINAALSRIRWPRDKASGTSVTPRPSYGDCTNCGKPCHSLMLVTPDKRPPARGQLVCSLTCAQALPVGGVGKAQETAQSHPCCTCGSTWPTKYHEPCEAWLCPKHTDEANQRIAATRVRR